jgi:hypothetical protein
VRQETTISVNGTKLTDNEAAVIRGEEHLMLRRAANSDYPEEANASSTCQETHDILSPDLFGS